MNQEQELPCRRKKRKKKKVATERAYVHEACGEATLVDGNDFEGLVNPFAVALKTYCVHCRRMVSLKNVVWADTGEPLSQYRKRMLKRIPLFWQYWKNGLGAVIVGLITAVIAVVMRPDDGAVIFVIGFVTGAVLSPMLLPAGLIPKYLGIDFRNIR